MTDDELGRQQDLIAELRLQLAREAKSAGLPETGSEFELLRLLLDSDEQGVREALTRPLLQVCPSFDPIIHVGDMLDALRAGDEPRYRAAGSKANLAALNTSHTNRR